MRIIFEIRADAAAIHGSKRFPRRGNEREGEEEENKTDYSRTVAVRRLVAAVASCSRVIPVEDANDPCRRDALRTAIENAVRYARAVVVVPPACVCNHHRRSMGLAHALHVADT